MILVVSDVFVGLLHSVRLKWRLSEQESIKDYAQRPDIRLVGVPLFLKNFRCNVVRSAADSPLLLALVVDLRGQSEVTELELHGVVYQDVAQLKIAVNDAITVDELQGFHHLQHVHLGLVFCDALPSFYQLLQRIVLAILQNNVHIFGVLENIPEGHDIPVSQ